MMLVRIGIRNSVTVGDKRHPPLIHRITQRLSESKELELANRIAHLTSLTSWIKREEGRSDNSSPPLSLIHAAIA